MPLVVPGINSSMGDKSEWANKLMGKTISNTTNETVRRLEKSTEIHHEALTIGPNIEFCKERPS